MDNLDEPIALAQQAVKSGTNTERYLQTLERAEQEIQNKAAWNRRLTLQLLRQEAESLINQQHEAARP